MSAVRAALHFVVFAMLMLPKVAMLVALEASSQHFYFSPYALGI